MRTITRVCLFTIESYCEEVVVVRDIIDNEDYNYLTETYFSGSLKGLSMYSRTVGVVGLV